MKAKRILVAVMAAMMCAGAFVACNKDDGPNEPTEIGITELMLSQDDTVHLVSMFAGPQAGEPVQLTASVLPTNATAKVEWLSSDPLVATVSETGLVSPIAAGVTVITAKSASNGAVSDEVPVKVTDEYFAILSIDINRPEVELIHVDDTARLRVITTPRHATYQKVSWASAEPEYVAVDEASGNLTAVKIDRNHPVEVTATVDRPAEDGGPLTVSSLVTVVGVPVTGIALNAEAMEVTKGRTGQLQITWSPSTPFLPTDTLVVWKSSDETKATVDENGLITAVDLTAEGEPVTVTATTNDVDEAGNPFTASVLVTVVPELVVPDFSKIAEITVGIGAKYAAKPTWTPVDNPDPGFDWTSSDESVATVDLVTGEITPLAAGETTISAEPDLGETKSYKLIVDASVPEGVILVGENDLFSMLKGSVGMASVFQLDAGENYVVSTVNPAANVAHLTSGFTLKGEEGGARPVILTDAPWRVASPLKAGVSASTAGVLADPANYDKIDGIAFQGIDFKLTNTANSNFAFLNAGEGAINSGNDNSGNDGSYGLLANMGTFTFKDCTWDGFRGVLRVGTPNNANAKVSVDGFVMDNCVFMNANTPTIANCQVLNVQGNPKKFSSVVFRNTTFNNLNAEKNAQGTNIVGLHQYTGALNLTMEACTIYDLRVQNQLIRLDQMKNGTVTVKDCLFAKDKEPNNVRVLWIPNLTAEDATITLTQANNYNLNDFIPQVNQPNDRIQLTLYDKSSPEVLESQTDGILKVIDPAFPANVGDPRGRQ